MSHALTYLAFKTIFSMLTEVNNPFPSRANRRGINDFLPANICRQHTAIGKPQEKMD
jgi:hypothetical protein